MQFTVRRATSSMAALLLFAGVGLGQIVDDSDDLAAAAKQSRSPLVATWHSLSLSMSLEDGNHRTITDEQGAASLIITEKTFTLRMGTKVFGEMSYTADPKQKPCTIDLKSKDGEMLGIYRLTKDRLKISLNDKAKGRPRDFDEQRNGLVVLLRRVYPVALYTVDADGANLRRVLLMRDFTFVGSPEWSPDGRRIALDTWRPTMGEGCGDARILTINADGRSLADLGWGAMPSWSPDGTQLVCSQYGRQDSNARVRGVWIMSADGKSMRLIDNNGWGAQWSPKRNRVSYVVSNNRGGVELAVYDLTKQSRYSLALGKTYSQIVWGHTWSPDGKWICFKGNLSDGGCEIAAVATGEGKRDFKVIVPSTAQPDVENADATIGWGGTGDRILLATQRKDDPGSRLYFFDVAGKKPPQLLPKVPGNWQATSPAWSADGKKVAFAAVSTPAPPPSK
jgi:TolB protein